MGFPALGRKILRPYHRSPSRVLPLSPFAFRFPSPVLPLTSRVFRLSPFAFRFPSYVSRLTSYVFYSLIAMICEISSCNCTNL